ncbi:pro-thyrotropin-releasing hormone [Mustelus asterias]
MRSAWFLLLGYLTLHKCVTANQQTPAGGAGTEAMPLEEMLQRAENILIRSMLMRMAEQRDDNALDTDSLPAGELSKRQHPGKRAEEEFEKRQHPGKRQEGEAEEGAYLETEKRQHPGRRELDGGYLEIQTRQHPGRRSPFGQYSGENAFLGELAKTQHPAERSLLYSKRQHPGRRSWEDGSDSGEWEPLERGQTPGRRYPEVGSSSSELSSPCEDQGPVSCSKPSYLLEQLLGKMDKNWPQVKRQHPGRRLASDSQLEGRV